MLFRSRIGPTINIVAKRDRQALGIGPLFEISLYFGRDAIKQIRAAVNVTDHI